MLAFEVSIWSSNTVGTLATQAGVKATLYWTNGSICPADSGYIINEAAHFEKY